MAVTRIKNNQITDATVVANAKLVDYSISSAKLANNLTYNSNFTIAGNLTVQGNTTQIDTTITTIEDPVIVLASTQTSGAPVVDIGFLGYRGNQSNIAFVWDESADEFVTAFTSTGETNTTITITSYADFHTNNANVGGNLTVGGNISITGNIASLNVTGNITGGNLLTPGLLSAAGNVTGGNVLTGGAVSATANVTGGNLLTGGLISATSTITSAANITGGNVLTGGLISATANITGGNVLTGGLISATSTITSAANITGGNLLTGGLISATSTITSAANITGGNLLTGGLISATSTITSAANITGGNITTAGLITATGNVTGGNLLYGSGIVSGTGNIYANNFIGNISGNIDAGGANTEIQFNDNNVLAGSPGFTFDKTSNAVVANGNITGSNFNTAGLITATGNITGGNVLTAGVVSATANVTGGNLLTAGLISATSTITSAANITGGNVLTGGLVSATANVTGGNLLTAGAVSATADVTGGNILTAGLVSAAGNVIANNVITDNVISSGALTITTGSNGNILIQPNGTGNIVLSNTYINSVAYPVQDQDAASKIYVDNLVSTAISYHDAVFAATTGTLATATGGTITYNQPNGAGNGIGATLTTTGSFNLIDTANVQTANTRILVKNEANAAHNGVYVWSNATVITRSADTNTYGAGNVDALGLNDYFFVTDGSVNKGSAWIVDAPTGTITFGTSLIQFAQFSQSQTYTAGNGISINGTVISAKVDNNTTAFDGSGNIIVKAGANLTTPNIGAATGTSLSATGNIQGGNLLTDGALSATANVTGGNITTGGVVTATGNVTGGNVLTGGLISATGTITSAANITGGNLLTGGLISATSTITSAANITGGNILTGGLVSATANVTGGNLLTGGLISATSTITSAANITGGNVLTGGLVSATGNVTGGNLLYGSGIVSGTGNIYAANFIGNISGNIDAGGANTEIQFNDNNVLAGSPGFTFDKTSNAVTANGNITGANFVTAGLVTATGNITGGNVLTGGLISATSTITSAANITGGNLLTGGLISATSTITSAANVIGGNISTAGLVTATGNVTGGNVNTAGLITATGNIYGGNLILAGAALDTTAGRLTVNSTSADADFAVNGDTVANVFYIDAGTGTASFGSATQTVNALVAFNATNSVLMPVGNTGQRPSTGVTGMLRFNTTDNNLEIYNNSQWEAVGVPAFTVIADEQFNGDGSTVAFTLATSQTTNSCIVSINGVVQIPTVAYSVSGTTLTFTEAPLTGDLIDVRQITTTTTVTALSNGSGNAEISASDTSPTINVTGNMIPTLNNTYTLGNSTNRWANLFVSGNSIYLGNLILKENPANVFVVYLADGVTQANIDVGNVDVSAITSGTSTIGIYGTGQAYMSVNGNANVLLASNTSVLVNGAFSATGNITGNYIFGNGSQLTGIDATSIQNGTANVRTFNNGNVTTSASGTANVVVVTSAGQLVTGIVSATGNISGSYFIGNGSQLTGIDATAIQNGTANVRTFLNGNVTTSAGGTANVLNVTSTGAIITGDLSVTGNATLSGNILGDRIQNGTTTIDIQTTNGNANVTVGGTSNVAVFATTGLFVTGLTSVSGNVTGGNLLTGGLVSATSTITSAANITGGNILTGGLVSATGNVSGGNLNVTGNIVDTGALSIITGSNGNIALAPNGTGIVTASGAFSAVGNVTGGNVLTGGLISATGAITGAALTGTSLTVSTGNVTCGNIVNANGNGVGNIGSSTTYFNTVFAKATSAQYADLAEKYTADADYEPGTVVMFGGSEEVTVCSNDACRRVAGVVSTNPSYIMNGTLEAAHVATVALTGRVPCRVTGTVRKGDLMVSAGNGRARAEADPKVGTVIGKALADFDGTEGVIEVVVGRF